MKCKCLNDLKDKLKEQQPYKTKGLTIDTVNFPDLQFAFNANMMTSILGVRLKIKFLEMKKDQIRIFIPSYCPFCGVKQDGDLKEKKEVPNG